MPNPASNSSIPSCRLLEEACERNFSKENIFYLCTTASAEFVLLEEEVFRDILQHPGLTVVVPASQVYARRGWVKAPVRCYPSGSLESP